jgi:hypothetical protein
MGYRSDVAYVIKFDDIQTRDAYVTLMLAHDDPEVRKAIEECDYDNARDPIITFKDTDVKWYPSFPEVIAHKFIYENAHALEMGSYRFLALGEDGQEECETETIHDGHELWDYINTRHELVTSF